LRANTALCVLQAVCRASHSARGKANVRARKLASRLLRAVARLSSADSQDWVNAMLRELDFIENDWAALFWALGSTAAIFRQSGRGFRKWFRKGSNYEEARMNNIGKKTVGVVAGIVFSGILVACAFGLLYLTSRLFPALGLDRIEWTHWLTVIVIPETIFIIAAVKLWRKRAPVALGVVLFAAAVAVHVVVHVTTHVH
jgi:hypothetical protein